MLGQTIEEEPARLGVTAIEPEGEFVEVIVEMGVLDSTLVGADQPSLEQRGDEVDEIRRARCGGIDTTAMKSDVDLHEHVECRATIGRPHGGDLHRR